jgi:uncharacterized protein (TIGR03067 family)
VNVRRIVTFATVAVALWLAPADGRFGMVWGIEDAAAGLGGTWSVMSMRDAGTELPKRQVQSLRFLFGPERLVIRMSDQVLAESDYTLDSTREPGTIRMTYGGQPTLGIYRREEDRLWICLSGSSTRVPNEFASQPDSHNRMLIILRRGDIGPVGRPLFVVQADGSGLQPLADLPADIADRNSSVMRASRFRATPE